MIVVPIPPGGFCAFSPAIYRYRIREPRGDGWGWGPEGLTNSLHWLFHHAPRDGQVEIRRESGELLTARGPDSPWYWSDDAGNIVGLAVNFTVCEAWNYPEMQAKLVAAEPKLAKWFG